jgi:hypothetical protein
MVVLPDHYDDAPHRGLTEETYTAILLALATKPQALGPLLAELHPADIADVLERLPRAAAGAYSARTFG